MKPLGLEMTIGDMGLGCRLKMPSRVEDAIWEAVQEAVNANWTPERFKKEVVSAWEDKLRDDAKHARSVLQ